MKSVYLPNLDILEITHKNRVYYGGSQQFYPKASQRFCGCGPTTGANQLLYLAFANPKYRPLYLYKDKDYKSVVSFMNIIWEYITPCIQGVNTLEILSEGLKRYGKDQDISLKPEMLEIDPDNVAEISHISRWLFDKIEKGNPVAFLNLDNGGVRGIQTWHWVLLVGVEVGGNTLNAIVYDEGERKTVDLALWINRTAKKGGFVSLA